MQNTKKLLVSLVAIGVMSGCSSPQNGVALKKSYLAKSKPSTSIDSNPPSEQKATREIRSELIYLPTMASDSVQQSEQINLSSMFSADEKLKLAADTLTVKDYLHYVFGELLGANYILGEAIQNSQDRITLNFQKELSKRDLFEVSQELLEDRNVSIKYNDGIFYIHKVEAGSNNYLTYGYGNRLEDIPTTSGEIVQIAPFQAGMISSMASTISQMTGIDVRQMFQQNALLIKGKRVEIVRALEFMQLMDQPIFRNRQVALYKAEFIVAKELAVNLQNILKQEGISLSTNGSPEQAISVITLDRTNTLVMFANEKKFLARVDFWAKQLDKPADGNEKQFFIFEPEFARALDLGTSIKSLIGGVQPPLSNKTSASSESTDSGQVQSDNVALRSNDLNMVVDERANALIFETTGERYRTILPLIKRLDVLPKQVVLEVMIAEVKLTDVFNQGVSFALTNQGADITGGFKLESKADTGFTYALSGLRGSSLAINLLETNSNVNVLSRPTLAVRDGVSANIAVGDRIPIVGDIVSDVTNGSRQSVKYLETGIDLKVTPTVNAQGVVLMEIEQKISKQAKGGSSVQGNPTILDRTVSTEVIAGDGQTILLGGLIDENSTANDRRTPFFSDIPILGKLFDGVENDSTKTELVVLVTPRIVSTTDHFEEITKEFSSLLQNFEKNE